MKVKFIKGSNLEGKINKFLEDLEPSEVIDIKVIQEIHYMETGEIYSNDGVMITLK